MQPFTKAFFAYDKEDKFLETPWYSNIGVMAAGFTNGALVGGFEKGKGEIFRFLKAQSSETYQAGIEFMARGIGVTAEFSMTAFSKSKYKYLSFEGYGEKSGKSVPKVLGYLLTTYY